MCAVTDETAQSDRQPTGIKFAVQADFNSPSDNTIALAKHLNMEIVAEGIETEDQVNFLRDLGCDMIQGFYFAKPMPVNEFQKLMGYANL